MTYFSAPGIIRYKRTSLSINEIEECTCNYFNIKPEDLHVRKRDRPLVQCRQIIYYLARELTSLGVIEIGRYFNQDHTTVVHSTSTIEGYYKYDEKLRRDIDKIKENLKFGL